MLPDQVIRPQNFELGSSDEGATEQLGSLMQAPINNHGPVTGSAYAGPPIHFDTLDLIRSVELPGLPIKLIAIVLSTQYHVTRYHFRYAQYAPFKYPVTCSSYEHDLRSTCHSYVAASQWIQSAPI